MGLKYSFSKDYSSEAIKVALSNLWRLSIKGFKRDLNLEIYTMYER